MGTLTKLGVGATTAAVALQLFAPAVVAQVTDGSQTIAIANDGDADADTGDNDGTGNNSDNDADVDQDDVPGGDLNTANGTSGNASGGTADIGTGNAAATGNRSRTAAAQQATPGDGVVVFDQSVGISNSGEAEAETGENDAEGNDSENDADIFQDGDINFANASNQSDGSSSITTGNACAAGNVSDTEVFQSLGGASTFSSASSLPDDPCETKDAGPKPDHKPEGPGAPKDGGEALARTGADLSELALAGAGITVIGGYLKRRARKTAA